MRSSLTSRNVSYPEVYVKEVSSKQVSIVGTATSVTAFVGLTQKGPLNKATKISRFYEFTKIFGNLMKYHNVGHAVNHFFLNGGSNAIIVSVGNEKFVDSNKIVGQQNNKSGIYCLDAIDNFNILCIPRYDETETTNISVYQKASKYCKKRRAILLVDPPSNWKDIKNVIHDLKNFFCDENAAIYFPRVKIKDKLNFVPCGIVAGVIARTDSVRGVWKLPAGTDTTIYGIDDFMINLNNDDIGMLNVKAVNCLKKIPSVGSVIWGARTMKGNNVTENEWKHLAVRRTALFIEESLNQGLQWAVFEPNDEPLWSSIRSNVNSFLNDLFRQGHFLPDLQTKHTL